MTVQHAITRLPGSNFAEGLTTAQMGSPDYSLTLHQHQAYCQALQQCGLQLTELGPLEDYPDSTFIEDVAVLLPGCAVITRPGASSRQGEIEQIRPLLSERFPRLEAIQAPGTMDGGDICEAGSHFFIGISHRTNEEGARQLAAILGSLGFTASTVDIRQEREILHLKSGIACLEGGRLVLIPSLSGRAEFVGWPRVVTTEEEAYGANCVQVNDFVLMASGFPRLQKDLLDLGYHPLVLDMSEYRKMDGGLSCLSLRY